MITRFTGTPMRESGHATRLRTSEATATPIVVGTHHQRSRIVVPLQASLNTCAVGWPLASGAGPAGSLQSLVQRQFSISGRSSRCSRM
jgi:hypothetical protein